MYTCMYVYVCIRKYTYVYVCMYVHVYIMCLFVRSVYKKSFLDSGPMFSCTYLPMACFAVDQTCFT